MTKEELKTRLTRLGPGTVVEVSDLTGGGDHWAASIVSPVFAGKMKIEQHQMVYALLAEELKSGEVHALKLETKAQ